MKRTILCVAMALMVSVAFGQKDDFKQLKQIEGVEHVTINKTMLDMVAKSGGDLDFGENLSVLTNEIFGSEEVKPYFKNRIAELKDEGYEYEDIVRMIQSGDIPLGLNLQMYVKNLMEG